MNYKKKLNNITEALSHVDNQQDVQEILNFINKTLDKRKNLRRTINLVNKMKDCALELSEIAPSLLLDVTECYTNRETEIDFQGALCSFK